jgi:hypothetical protein
MCQIARGCKRVVATATIDNNNFGAGCGGAYMFEKSANNCGFIQNRDDYRDAHEKIDSDFFPTI